ncbi:hypothetical protein Acr_00g0018120 [Actinidia rufa]|uniref:Uncharacterized protein n=1 Tax=Actinidia rufa TaxID=165716 RepID=A0A7J0DCT3_9ERIC|nr:hypothetical protein Acr_00g0018120 [Actinidia rufa]
MEVTYSKTVKVRFKGDKGDELSHESDTQKKIVMDDDDDEGGDASASHDSASSLCCCGRHHVMASNNNWYGDGNLTPPEPNYYPSAPPWPGTYAYPYPHSYVEENSHGCNLM